MLREILCRLTLEQEQNVTLEVQGEELRTSALGTMAGPGQPSPQSLAGPAVSVTGLLGKAPN